MKVMLTIKEAVEYSGLPYAHIRQLCIDGKVNHIRSGRKYYINKEHFDLYLSGNPSGSRADGMEVDNGIK